MASQAAMSKSVALQVDQATLDRGNHQLILISQQNRTLCATERDRKMVDDMVQELIQIQNRVDPAGRILYMDQVFNAFPMCVESRTVGNTGAMLWAGRHGKASAIPKAERLAFV
jgi:hypothetical protein